MRISYDGFKEQFKALVAIESERSSVSKSVSKKERKLRRLICSINYEGSSSIERLKEGGQHLYEAQDSLKMSMSLMRLISVFE